MLRTAIPPHHSVSTATISAGRLPLDVLLVGTDGMAWRVGVVMMSFDPGVRGSAILVVCVIGAVACSTSGQSTSPSSSVSSSSPSSVAPSTSTVGRCRGDSCAGRHPLAFTHAKGWKTRVLTDPYNAQGWAVRPALAGNPPGDAGSYFWRRLPRTGVLIMVGVEIPANQSRLRWTRRSYPFSVQAMLPTDHWEGQPLQRLQLRGQNGRVGLQRVDVMVTFGNLHPTAAELDAAQAELGRLLLPMRP
jgi:hypothetical protein